MKLKWFKWKASPGDRSAHHGRRAGVDGNDKHAYNIKGLPVDVLEHVFHFLDDTKDVLALAASCKLLRDVASSPRVWADLTQRRFLFEELPQDLEFLSSQDTALIREQFWRLSRQRPAFLSDAPRTSEITEHTGSRFRKVLHVDGRRDFNFTTVFRDVPPGQYNVVWRLMLQPGYVRGYCNFRAVFSRPADPKAAARRAKPTSTPGSSPGANLSTALKQRLLLCRGTAKADPEATAAGAAAAARGALRLRLGARGPVRRRGRLSGRPASVAPLDPEDDPFPVPEDGAQPELPAGEQAPADLNARPQGRGPRTWRVRRPLRWLPPCVSPTAVGAAAEPADPSEGSNGSSRSGSVSSSATGSSGSARGGDSQRAVPVTVPGPSAVAPLSRSQSASSSAPPLLPDNHQQQQQERPYHQQPQAPPSQAGFAQMHPGVPEIEPEAPPQPPLPQAPPPPPPPPPPPQPLLQRPSAIQQRGPQVQLQRAMGQLATASAKRDAALAAAAAGGPRYVPRWLSPLWGSHASAWRQLDPAGPLGAGAWRRLHLGTLTLRRGADAHLHGVMVQLRPVDAAQLEAALPAGETRWRGALVDYVELVPVRSGGRLLGGKLLPLRGFLRRGGSLQRGSPVVPDMYDVVEVPRL